MLSTTVISNWNISEETILRPSNLIYCCTMIYMCVHCYMDWCNSTAQPILRFPFPFLSLSPLFHPCCPRHHCHFPSCFAVAVKVTLHGCAVHCYVCVWLCVRFSWLENTAESLIIIVNLNCILHCFMKWKWKGVSGREYYYHFTIHNPPPSHTHTHTLVFFQWSASCRKQTDVACELICV